MIKIDLKLDDAAVASGEAFIIAVTLGDFNLEGEGALQREGVDLLGQVGDGDIK